jgi:hypothetical protein
MCSPVSSLVTNELPALRRRWNSDNVYTVGLIFLAISPAAEQQLSRRG